MTPSPRSTLAAVALGALLVTGAAACGDGPGDGRAAAQSEPTRSSIEVTGATIDWPANPSVAAVRMQVSNPTARDDRLVSVSSPVAGATSIHRSGTDDQGRSTMRPVDGVAIPARSTVTFEPGGLHVMLSDIREDLAVGDQVPLVITFEHAGAVEARAKVVEPGSADGDTGGSHEH
jgi:copper(I)-binding protein